jgi:hypothetical protein
MFGVETMQFKGLELFPGDHIVFEAPGVPLSHIEAAVTKVDDDTLEVLCPVLAALGEPSVFTASEIGKIAVLRAAEDAVPRGSRERRFAPRQKVVANIRGHAIAGEVVAAFEGIIVIRNAEGHHVRGGAAQFHRQR